MGKERIDALMILLQTLPGISFTYNGDELGMEDHSEITWEDTQDIQVSAVMRIILIYVDDFSNNEKSYGFM
jgi:glycosidase